MKKIFFFLLLLFLFIIRLQFLSKYSVLKNGQTVKVTGVLREEPQASGNQQLFKLGQFKIAAAKYPEFHYGDEIEIIGKCKMQNSKFKIAIQNSKLFELSEVCLLNYPEISANAMDFCKGRPCTTRPPLIKGLAVSLKNKLLEVYKKSFPGIYDGIMAGVVLGDKSLITKDFWDKLKATGTLHMMVASGMNIAMFSEGLLKLICAIFVRKISLLILISLIWFYTLMAGLQPPIVRAAVMASMIYLGQFFGRQTEGKRVLWTTGILMVFLSPELLFDIGFQLSFMATGGLVYIQPKFKGFIKASPCTARGGLLKLLMSDNFTSSISAQLATLPILLLNFGQLNLISPLINLLVLWTIPFLLQAGMIIGILGKPASYLLYPLLFYLEQIITWSAKLTIFQWQAPKIGWCFVMAYYFILWLWIRSH